MRGLGCHRRRTNRCDLGRRTHSDQGSSVVQRVCFRRLRRGVSRAAASGRACEVACEAAEDAVTDVRQKDVALVEVCDRERETHRDRPRGEERGRYRDGHRGESSDARREAAAKGARALPRDQAIHRAGHVAVGLLEVRLGKHDGWLELHHRHALQARRVQFVQQLLRGRIRERHRFPKRDLLLHGAAVEPDGRRRQQAVLCAFDLAPDGFHHAQQRLRLHWPPRALPQHNLHPAAQWLAASPPSPLRARRLRSRRVACGGAGHSGSKCGVDVQPARQPAAFERTSLLPNVRPRRLGRSSSALG
mmetsp:Transcript_57152/g.169940  ORF Transcript_57152/g.169940 Transcript_57152/m.169940 type:complete len:304 (+) Transcript_57152:1289-2200(+)